MVKKKNYLLALEENLMAKVAGREIISIMLQLF
jgi:hypothetical protein